MQKQPHYCILQIMPANSDDTKYVIYDGDNVENDPVYAWALTRITDVDGFQYRSVEPLIFNEFGLSLAIEAANYKGVI